MLNRLKWAILTCALCPSVWAEKLPECLFISSYHVGYAWSDGVERGLNRTLQGKCHISNFNMDTKRNTSEAHVKKVALEAKALIEQLKPDVVIASDDAAAKYLIVPYFKDSTVPFVFCGINWTVEKYGFPFSNVTGMIEVAAVSPLFQKAASITGEIKHATYIGADTLTETKNLAHFQQAAKASGIRLTSQLSSTRRQWIASYKQAQASDLIIIGSHAGIEDWDQDKILKAITPHTRKLSVTNHGWMMPFTMFGMTKVPEEQGEWAGELALEILNGTKPADIPIIPNRKFDIIINKDMLSAANIEIPEFIRLKAQLHHR